MKNVVLMISLFCLVCIANAQDEDNLKPWVEDINRNWKIKNKADSLEYENAYIRYNLGKYYDLRETGRLLMGLGYIISGVGCIILYNETPTVTTNKNISTTQPADHTISTIFLGAGTLVYLIGGSVCLTANKYIKYAAIKPSTYGVSIDVAIPLSKKEKKTTTQKMWEY